MNIDISTILTAGLGTLVVIAAAIVGMKSFLTNKMGVDKYNEVYSKVYDLVIEAEQMYSESGMGSKKKEYVIKAIAEKTKLNTEVVSYLIDFAVEQMNKILKNNLNN